MLYQAKILSTFDKEIPISFQCLQKYWLLAPVVK